MGKVTRKLAGKGNIKDKKNNMPFGKGKRMVYKKGCCSIYSAAVKKNDAVGSVNRKRLKKKGTGVHK